MRNLLLRIAVVLATFSRRATDALTIRYRALTAQPTAGSGDIPWTAIIMVGAAVLATAVIVLLTTFVNGQLAKLPQ